MSYEAFVLTEETGRHLASCKADRLREVTSWFRRNAETWRSALEPEETHFEVWVFSDEATLPILHVRHSKDYGDDGVVTSRSLLRQMVEGLNLRGRFLPRRFA